MSRPTAAEQVRRLLALVPWLAQRSPVPVEEACERFGIDEKTLMRELGVLSMVGVPPYSPDTLIWVDTSDGMITLDLVEPFDRPLRLTYEQALDLVAAGRSIREVPGADSDDPLQRGLAKLADALGVDPNQVHVGLGEARDELLDSLTGAIAHTKRIELDYYTSGRDERTVRQVDPFRLVADRGKWYLVGWCHRSDDLRVFRVDRVAGVEVLDDPASEPPEDLEWERYVPGSDDPRVTLDLSPAARWVVEHHPYEQVEERPDGWLRATLAVGAPAWFERLLVVLGPDARIVEAPPELAGLGQRTARRILARYGAT